MQWRDAMKPLAEMKTVKRGKESYWRGSQGARLLEAEAEAGARRVLM